MYTAGEAEASSAYKIWRDITNKENIPKECITHKETKKQRRNKTEDKPISFFQRS